MQFDNRLHVKIENEMDCSIARLARIERISVAAWVRAALWKAIKDADGSTPTTAPKPTAR
jgi:predicted HicB family RNase H-like nuclease